MPYATKDVLRGRRRTATAILGVVLAVTFIAGTFIAIDSSTRATLNGLLANYRWDVSFSAPSGNATQVREAVASVPGVVGVATALRAAFSEIEPTGRPNATASVQVVGVEPGHLPGSLEGITITQGSLGLPRGMTALMDRLAEDLGVVVGDSVAFVVRTFPDPYNVTINRVNATVAAIFRGGSYDENAFIFPGFDSFGYPTALIHVQDVDWYHEQLGVVSFNYLSGEVRVDRDRLIDPYDLDASRRNMARLSRQITTALGPFGGSVTADYIGGQLSNFAGLVTLLRALYFAMSGPVILLGLYLGAVGVDLGHAERRRELAVLKTRGASRRQLLALLLAEAALGGFLAAIIGLVAGVGLSRLLLGYVSPFGGATAPRYDVLVFSTSTVLTVVILSILFMAVTSFRSARRTANLPIVETLRHYAPGETKIHYRPMIDVILIALAVASYGVVLYSQSNPQDFFTFLIGAFFFILLPVAPVFLIIGGTRLLTRSTGRVYEWTARVAKPFAKNLHYVIAKNLQRNPRRSANVAVIVALGIAFGMFILVTFSSQLAYQERQVRASVGADVSVTPPTLDPSFGTNLSAVPGIAGVTRVASLRATPVYGFAGVHALDPATYFTVTQPEWWYFRSIGADVARQVLATPGQVLVTEAYLEQAFLEIGDRLRIDGTLFTGNGSQQVSVETTIGGTVRGLPALGFYGFGLPTAIFGSFETFGPVLQTSDAFFPGDTTYLADLAPGSDWRAVKAAIQEMGVPGLQVADEGVERLRSNPVFQSFFGFMQLEMAFMVVILTAGLGLILYAATLERDVELAAIRARGASGWQTAGLLIGEAASIMLIGLLVGGGIGTLSAYLSNTIVAAGPGGGAETLVPLAFTIPLEAILLLALAPVAILVTSFLVSARVARMDIGRVLKLRGG